MSKPKSEKNVSLFSHLIPVSVATAGVVGMLISLIIGITIGGAIERSHNVPAHIYAPGPNFGHQQQFHYWLDATTGTDVRGQQA
jgi:hypothetical protein